MCVRAHVHASYYVQGISFYWALEQNQNPKHTGLLNSG